MIDLGSKWAYIEEIAKERLKHNKTERHVDRYGEKIETMGAAGELAARRCLGLPEELGTRFDGGTDFIYNALKIDVKATSWTKRIQFRYLQWPVWKPIRAQVILMTAIDMTKKKAIILGYATHYELLSAPVNSTRYYPCHEIPVQNLHGLWEIMIDKPKRISSKKAVQDVRNRDGVCLYGLYKRQQCSGGLDVHHMKTRGSGGGDTLDNMICLCRRHHDMVNTGQISNPELRHVLHIYYGYEYEAPIPKGAK